jgi:hypothetical protein
MFKTMLNKITPTFNRKEIVLNKNGEPYLIRYIIYGKKGALNKQHHGRGLYLQKRIKSDISKDLYDHPWRWGRLILWGQFKEQTRNKNSILTRVKKVNPLHLTPVVSSRFSHSIELHNNKTVWMLFWHGRARNQWGFWIDNKKVSWREYFKINSQQNTAQD